MAGLTPKPKMQFFDSNGNFLAGGKVYTYEAGTSTPLATYTDETEATPNTNPVVLDAKGQAPIWFATGPYKIVVHDASDVLQGDGGDNIRVATADIEYLYTYGIGEWDSTREYSTGSLVNVSGITYISLADTNTGNNPTSDGTKWEAQSVKVITSIADLRLTDGRTLKNIYVTGYYAAGDNGGGSFYWDSTATDTDNGGTIIKVTAVTTGRWKRVYTDAINAKWFGVVGDGATDDTASLQAAIGVVQVTHGSLVIPQDCAVRITSPVTGGSVRILGESRDTSIIFVDFDGIGLTLNADSLSDVEVSNLTVTGLLVFDYVWPTRSAQVGLVISSTLNYQIKNCMFRNLWKGVEIYGLSYYGLINGNKWLVTVGGLQLKGSAIDDYPSESTVSNNQFGGFATTGATFDSSYAINFGTGGSGYKLIGNGIENYGTGVEFGVGTQYCILAHNRFEDNNDHYIQNAADVGNSIMIGGFQDVPNNGYTAFVGTSIHGGSSVIPPTFRPGNYCGFLAKSVLQSAVTGDGTLFTLGAGVFTETEDTGGCFTDGTFIAGKDGLYQFDTNLSLDGISSSHVYAIITLSGSFGGRVLYEGNLYSYSGSAAATLSLNTVIDMTAAETASLKITVYSGAKTINILADSHFSGSLVVK